MEDYYEYNNYINNTNDKLTGTDPKKSIPVYIEPTNKQVWENIIAERNLQNDAIKTYEKSKKCLIPDAPPNPEVEFLEDNIFPILLPILEKTLITAMKADCIKHQKSLFNGIDYIAECLWNMNNKYPERSGKSTNIFFIPFVQEWLVNHPRPIFPKSWIWSREIATVKIQSYMRGHFIRKRDDVQEMRQFWKVCISLMSESLTHMKDSCIKLYHSNVKKTSVKM